MLLFQVFKQIKLLYSYTIRHLAELQEQFLPFGDYQSTQHVKQMFANQRFETLFKDNNVFSKFDIIGTQNLFACLTFCYNIQH